MGTPFMDGFTKQAIGPSWATAIKWGARVGKKALGLGARTSLKGSKLGLNAGKGFVGMKSAKGAGGVAGKALKWGTFTTTGLAATGTASKGISSFTKKRPRLVRNAMRRY